MSKHENVSDTLKKNVERIISEKVNALNRPDLFRQPLFAYSDAKNPKYKELKTIVGSWHKTPDELLPGAECAISYFIPFTKEVVSGPLTALNGSEIWSEAYVIANNAVLTIDDAVTEYLSAEGFETALIRGTGAYDQKELKSMWSHRSAAAIADLGKFGDNRLLITEKGSGGRFCTILTTAPIEPGCETTPKTCLRQQNGSCGKCFEICPVQTLRPGEFDRFVCNDDVLLKNAETFKYLGFADACGKCISACPLSYIE